MRFPLKLTANLTRYITGKRLSGAKKFPLVMMLEPLHACNLTCTGSAWRRWRIAGPRLFRFAAASR